MSLEEALSKNTETMERLIAALEGGAAVSTTTTSTKAAPAAGKAAPAAGKAAPAAAGKGKVPKHTAEDVKAFAVRVKDEIGMDEAKNLIKTAGKADELASIKPANYDAFVAAAEELLEGGGAAEEENEEDGL